MTQLADRGPVVGAEAQQVDLARHYSAKQQKQLRRSSPRRRAGLAIQHVVLAALSLLWLGPVVLIVSTSLKTTQDVRVNPFGLFTSFSLENFSKAWVGGQFSDYVLNSILLTLPSTALILVLSTMGGYAFARLPFAICPSAPFALTACHEPTLQKSRPPSRAASASAFTRP